MAGVPSAKTSHASLRGLLGNCLNLQVVLVHELSVCQAMLAEVVQIAMQHDAASVERITVEIGRLSGIEPDLLARAFEFARVGGCAADAKLTISAIEVRVRCLECGAETETSPNRLLCAACGGYRTRVVGGEELCLRGVELRMSAPVAGPAT